MIPLELGFMRHDINSNEGQKLVNWAMEHGVNHFEACYFYLNNHCEPYLYSLLEKYPRESYYICGKLPIHGILNNKTHQQVFEEQLSRVPGGYFDTYILQCLDKTVMLDIKEKHIVEFFLQQKKEGKIKRFGLSIQCTPNTFRSYLDWKCWDVVQMPINYYDWFLCRYDENYKLACEYGLPIIAQAPVKGGLLVNSHNFQDLNYPLIDLAYSFVSSLDNVEMILCGNSTLDTFKQTYNACNNAKNYDLEIYKNIINDYVSSHYINCIRCGRCDKVCSQHLPLSAIFSLYNLGLTNKSYFNALDMIKSGVGGEPCNICDHCNRCIQNCPLQLNIPDILYKKVFELRT